MEKRDIVNSLVRYGIRDIREYRNGYYEVTVSERDTVHINSTISLANVIKKALPTANIIDMCNHKRNDFSGNRMIKFAINRNPKELESHSWSVKFNIKEQ